MRAVRNTGIVLIVCILVTLAVSGIALADSSEWPQFHNDAAGTGYTTSDAPDTSNILWISDEIDAKGSSSVAVSDGMVFVRSAIYTGDSGVPSYLYCLDEATGAVRWSVPTDDNEYGSWASPAYHDGKVFVSSGHKTVCLNADPVTGDGSVIWEFVNPHGESSVNGGPTVADGYVFCSEWDTSTGPSYFYCLDENTGYINWEFEVQGKAQATPAYTNGIVYFADGWSGSGVYGVNAATGTQVWCNNTTFSEDTCGSCSVADGKAFVATYQWNSGLGELAALDAATGAVVWGPVDIERTDSCPAYYNGYIYLSGGCLGYSYVDERTYCFNADTGAMIWQTPDDGSFSTPGIGDWTVSPAVADGKVYTGRHSPTSGMDFELQGTICLDAASGAVIWEYPYGGATPAIANGTVYTIGDGRVFAFKDSTYPTWDVNQDNSIDYLDMIMVGNHYGESGYPGWIPQDVSGDGKVNYLDMILVGNHYGE